MTSEQRNAQPLVRDSLAMHQRHEDELALARAQTRQPAASYEAMREGKRQGIEGVGARVVAMNVARELVEQQDGGARKVGRCQEPFGRNRAEWVQPAPEPRLQHRIDRVRPCEPVGRAQTLEPDIEEVLRPEGQRTPAAFLSQRGDRVRNR